MQISCDRTTTLKLDNRAIEGVTRLGDQTKHKEKSAMANLQQKSVELLAKLFPDAVFYKPTQETVVALTIDDVPTPGEAAPCSTRWILDAIADHNQSLSNPAENVQATFFVIGSHLNQDQTLLPDIVQAGHEIGNHGWVDTWPVLQTSRQFAEEFQQTHQALLEYVPAHPIRWYRPGRAFYNPQMLQVLQQMEGYEPYFALASMLPLDTLAQTAEPTFTAQYAAQHIFPGAILLLHGGDSARAKNTAVALRLILAELRTLGYRVVTLSQLWSLPDITSERG
jgi:peptidoglycan/xylan/chitin deacetylase (PgdA/CDA1 family)